MKELTQDQLDNWKEEPFDAYEIRLVADWENKGICEPVDAPEQTASKHYWTLYGHLPNGGVECIGDYKHLRYAMQIYHRINIGNLELAVLIPTIDALDPKSCVRWEIRLMAKYPCQNYGPAYFEHVEKPDPDAMAHYWTVYAVMNWGEEDVLIDCETEKEAIAYCDETKPESIPLVINPQPKESDNV